MPVKFGLSQIKEPSPKAVKFWVNLFIILGGAAATIIGVLPEEYLSLQAKTTLLTVGGVLAGALKAIEKLLGTSPPENTHDSTNGTP